MTGLEAATAAFHGVKPVILVLDNNGYGTQRPMKDGAFNDIPALQAERLPMVFGTGRGWLASTEDELDTALAEAMSTDELCIIRAVVPQGDRIYALELEGGMHLDCDHIFFALSQRPADDLAAQLGVLLLRAAASAAMAGLTRWVRPPLPCRPSKLRFEVEAQRSPGASTSGFMPRHIEQPAVRQSKPAAVKIRSSPSASACARTCSEPGTTIALTAAATERPSTTRLVVETVASRRRARRVARE